MNSCKYVHGSKFKVQSSFMTRGYGQHACTKFNTKHTLKWFNEPDKGLFRVVLSAVVTKGGATLPTMMQGSKLQQGI